MSDDYDEYEECPNIRGLLNSYIRGYLHSLKQMIMHLNKRIRFKLMSKEAKKRLLEEQERNSAAYGKRIWEFLNQDSMVWASLPKTEFRPEDFNIKCELHIQGDKNDKPN